MTGATAHTHTHTHTHIHTHTHTHTHAHAHTHTHTHIREIYAHVTRCHYTVIPQNPLICMHAYIFQRHKHRSVIVGTIFLQFLKHLSYVCMHIYIYAPKHVNLSLAPHAISRTFHMYACIYILVSLPFIVGAKILQCLQSLSHVCMHMYISATMLQFREPLEQLACICACWYISCIFLIVHVLVMCILLMLCSTDRCGAVLRLIYTNI